MNESFVKRTISTMDNIVERQIQRAKQKEFQQRIKESFSGSSSSKKRKEAFKPKKSLTIGNLEYI